MFHESKRLTLRFTQVLITITSWPPGNQLTTLYVALFEFKALAYADIRMMLGGIRIPYGSKTGNVLN